MSTRANIICYSCERDGTINHLATLYRHCDGYPTGLGVDLLLGLKDCDGDRRLLADLGKMDYPPEFTPYLHVDIEYLYKIYAGQMTHKEDKRAIQITVTPVELWDAPDSEYERLKKPGQPEEKDITKLQEVIDYLNEHITDETK